MNAAGPLMVALGLVLGVISAVTAYLPHVDAIDPARGDRVVLHAPAGTTTNASGKRVPLIAPGPPGNPLVLDEEHLRTLRDAGVRRVHAKGFSIRLWREWWLFALGTALLAGGAIVIRRAKRRALMLSAAHQKQTDVSPQLSAATLLEDALDAAQKLAGEMAAETDEAKRLHLVIDGVDALRERFFEPLELARPAIVHHIGLSGYARVMDRFAAAERQFNRAWSAAADHVPTEAAICIDAGISLLAAARDVHSGESAASRHAAADS